MAWLLPWTNSSKLMFKTPEKCSLSIAYALWKWKIVTRGKWQRHQSSIRRWGAIKKKIFLNASFKDGQTKHNEWKCTLFPLFCMFIYPLDFLIYFNDLGRIIIFNPFMTKKFSNYLSKKNKKSEIRVNTHLIKLLRLTKYEKRLYSETVQRSIRD